MDFVDAAPVDYVASAVGFANVFIRSGGDVHKATASLLFTVPVDEVTHDQRQVAKSYNMEIYRAICRFQVSNE